MDISVCNVFFDHCQRKIDQYPNKHFAYSDDLGLHAKKQLSLAKNTINNKIQVVAQATRLTLLFLLASIDIYIFT